MPNRLKQITERAVRFWVKRSGFSTTAVLTLALVIGVASVMLSVLYVRFEPRRYSKPDMPLMTSVAADKPEKPSSRLPERPPESSKAANSVASQTPSGRQQTRRRGSGSSCSLARANRSRISKQRNLAARCIQTGVRDTEHLLNPRGADTTLTVRQTSCTV